MDRKFLAKAGGGLVTLGASLLLFPFLFIGYSNYWSYTLRTQAETRFSASQITAENKIMTSSGGESVLGAQTTPTPPIIVKTGLYPEPAAELASQPQQGDIIGKLSIPALQIDEAILEGTDQVELAKAPGHLPDSVYPGQIGTSVIAAHNATIFRHLDQLKQGAEFYVTTSEGVFTFSVTGQRILRVVDPLPDTAYPSLALETCYPLDALYLTNKRLFIEAALVKSEFTQK